MRLGALPIGLKLISESQVSATLGNQALHQGLVAGAVGLLLVVVFLLSYYRVLGVIATAGLAVYALYFYALIKLIPITLTLPGIAGLILTIGVAADANIVIFERVKEEIRAGRSIRQGIATGYKKGLTAIIDANVVTIMTAFILFVLATADVQGFAFTLGIGTFVSLFTAVMATQAILMTMGNSRVIASPSALGAGGKRRVWRFDFMGASRYFFSMSGVILLIGALAIGGRGLNLGIDFTSGTRISVGLEHPATEQQVRSILSSAGASDIVVQKISQDKAYRPYGFQISSKQLPPSKLDQVRSELGTKFGISNNGTDIDTTSVGPTFGSTVANSAVIAIIASLLVISAYVALRFEWKFAIPVLIALMHDLLITSGVYALTGRTVSTATVAALLTILGYSMYDTIIVFDRVRENIPRMPRAAFSQIVNRSMAEVLTRSLATTSCTLMPIIALLIFGGGGELGDFAFALLIGVASGAYSSIFIASPVLTHWKERESVYRTRRQRIEDEFGYVPAYAATGGDVEPVPRRSRRGGRLTSPEPEAVSAAEFEQMKRDLEIERDQPSRHTSTLTKRLSHTPSEPEPPSRRRPAATERASGAAGKSGATGLPEPSPMVLMTRLSRSRAGPRTPRARRPTEPMTARRPSLRRTLPRTRASPRCQSSGGRRNRARAAGVTGGGADGHARLGDDGPSAVALHDLAAGPLLGRDRRGVRRRVDWRGAVGIRDQRLRDSGSARDRHRDRAGGDSRRFDRNRDRLLRGDSPRARRRRAADRLGLATSLVRGLSAHGATRPSRRPRDPSGTTRTLPSMPEAALIAQASTRPPRAATPPPPAAALQAVPSPAHPAGGTPASRLEIPSYDLGAALVLERELGISHVVAQVLVRRGLADPLAAGEFLDPREAHEPSAFAGIERAVALIERHAESGARITVHGDYDVDGVCATAIMVRALRARGANVGWFLPSRIEDGYGVSAATVERLASHGTRLLITVDCGITAVDEVAAARAAGVDVVVCDHHAPRVDGSLPDGAIVHPAVCGYPCPDLCGSAVAYKLAQALQASTTADDLELVALATIADLVPLRGENRRLAREGLAALASTARPGLRALMSVAGVDPSALDSHAVGFRLAPRINAAGRLARADAGLELLLTSDPQRAAEIAAELDAVNTERRAIEQRTVWEAEAQVSELGDRAAYVLAADGWHPGVIGIVASRVVERHHRPAILIAFDGEFGTGSGRSIPGFDLLDALHAGAEQLERYGGHRAAAGLTVRRERVGALRAAIEEHAERVLTADLLVPCERVDAVVSGLELGLPLAEELARLEPCGLGNPRARLLVPGARFGDLRPMGEGRHARFSVSSAGTHARAVAFGCDGRLAARCGEPLDATFRLERNVWMGAVEPRLVLGHAQPCAPPPIEVLGEPTEPGYLRAVLAELDLPTGIDRREDATAGTGSRAILDRRGGSPLAVLADALASGGRVLAVCADVPRRIGGLAARAGGFALTSYYSLAQRPELCAGFRQLVALDPPASAGAAALLTQGSGFTHLTWAQDELRFAEQIHEFEYALRTPLAALYRGLRHRGRVAGEELEQLLRGDGLHGRPPHVAARLIKVLLELELVSLDRDLPALAVADGSRTVLERSAAYRVYARQYEDGRRYLSSANIPPSGSLAYIARASPTARSGSLNREPTPPVPPTRLAPPAGPAPTPPVPPTGLAPPAGPAPMPPVPPTPAGPAPMPPVPPTGLAPPAGPAPRTPPTKLAPPVESTTPSTAVIASTTLPVDRAAQPDSDAAIERTERRSGA